MTFLIFVYFISSINLPLIEQIWGAGQSSFGGVSGFGRDPAVLMFNPPPVFFKVSFLLGAGYNENFSGFKDRYLVFADGRRRIKFGGGFYYSGARVLSSEGEVSIGSYVINGSVGFGWKNYNISTFLNLLREDFKLFNGIGYTFNTAFGVTFKKFFFYSSLRNLIGRYKVGGVYERIKSEFRGGFTWSLADISLGAEAVIREGEGPEFHAGVEVIPFKEVSFRVGIRNGPQNRSLGLATYGMGILYKNFDFNFAYVPYGELGNTYKFQVVYRGIAAILGGTRRAGRLQVLVVDEKGMPLDDVYVSSQGASYGEGITREGKVEFEIESEGWVYLRVEREGYIPLTDSILVRPDKFYMLKLKMHAQEKSLLQIYVYSSSSISPLEGKVQLDGPLKLEEVGTPPFNFDEILRGHYVVYFVGKGYKGRYEIDVNDDTVSLVLFAERGNEPHLLFIIPFEKGSSVLTKEALGLIELYKEELLKAKRVYLDGVAPPEENVEEPYELSHIRLLVTKRYLLDNYGLDEEKIYIFNHSDKKRSVKVGGQLIRGRVEVRIE